MKDRTTLRSDYCKADISAEELEKWLNTTPLSTTAYSELFGRFAEWNLKISKEYLKKVTPAEITSLEFIGKVNSFYEKYKQLLDSNYFFNSTAAKVNLREILLPELKTATAEDVIEKYNITDKELINRITHEWKALKA